MIELVRGRRAVAQLCVVRDGQVLVDEAYGCDPRGLFWTFSAGKPFVALLVHLLAERGRLALDDRVSAYWPGFARGGKEAVTIRQVLRHRSGLAGGMLGDALVMTDWDRSVRNLERARLRWPPGAVPAYQPIAYGFILGELVRRITGTGVRDLLHEELLGPLGLADTHLGLPAELWPRHVPISGRRPAGRLSQVFLNRPRTRAAVIPAAGVSTTARDLARLCLALLRGGELDGVRILAPATIEEARRPSSDGETDRVVGLPIRWAQGFQLGGPGHDPAASRPMGRLGSPETFGRGGSNACLAWADPTRRLAVCYLTDRLTPGHEGARHLETVSDTITAAFS